MAPADSPHDDLIRLPMVDVPLIDFIISFLTISLSIPIILWEGAKMFRGGLLMHGKRATLHDIWPIIREA